MADKNTAIATGLVDTHCHLQADAFELDRDAVLERALNQLEWLVVVGDDLPSSQAAVDMCRERVFATVGVHPHHANAAVAAGQTLWEQMASLARRPGVVALGEIGLDYYYDFSPRPEQRTIFARQLQLAADVQRPVVIHSRDADEDTINIIESTGDALNGGIMHCFGGGPAFAERCLFWGFYISFAGNVTYPKASMLREAAHVVPLDRILIETDSPYLSPQPLRGKRCEPAFVRHTAAFLAEIKGISVDEFARLTTAKAIKAFRMKAHLSSEE